MIFMTVNNHPVEAEAGETILSALRRAGIFIPTLCHLDGMEPNGSCRLCVVEIKGFRELVPSCSHPVEDGMVIQTNSPRVIAARRTILELLLANHPDDCLYCDRSRNCTLRQLSEEYGVRTRLPKTRPAQAIPDLTSHAVIRNPAKCILCGKCIRICQDVQHVSAIELVGRGADTIIAPAFNDTMNRSTCVGCGQCTLVCPTGALTEKSELDQVLAALADPKKTKVVQYAPSAPLLLAEEFSVKNGSDTSGLLNAALHQIGFQSVFQTAFGADLNIMETASELLERIRNGTDLPLFTACCPAWVQYVTEFYPEYRNNLSTVKSPQSILGSLIRKKQTEENSAGTNDFFHVAIMPCTAKKEEAATHREYGVDAVLTLREAVRLFRLCGVDLSALQPEPADHPFSNHSTSGKLFGTSGGVAEAVLRTAHKLATGRDLKTLRIDGVRGIDNVRETKVRIDGMEIGVAVASGLAEAKALMEKIRAGVKPDLHFVEIMACPGGCIGGGGQLIPLTQDLQKTAQQSLYATDQSENLRTAHGNPDVAAFYQKYGTSSDHPEVQALLHTNHQRESSDK